MHSKINHKFGLFQSGSKIFFSLFQHYLTMLGGTLAIPFIISGPMCFANNTLAISEVLSTIFFVSGLVTVLQATFGVRFVYSKDWDLLERFSYDLENGFDKCTLFILSANGWKDQNMDPSFPAKENPNIEKELFDWSIMLQYYVKSKYRLISRKFFGHEVFSAEPSLNQPKATRVCISSKI